MSTSSVRSSGAARRKTAVRNRETPDPPVNNSTLMPSGHPAPTHCPQARTPTRAHPAVSTNKGGRGCGLTWVGLMEQECVFPSRGLCGLPFLVPGRSRTGYKSYPKAGLPPRDTGCHVLPYSPGSLQGEKVGLQSSSNPPSSPTSNLFQTWGRRKRHIGPSWNAEPQTPLGQERPRALAAGGRRLPQSCRLQGPHPVTQCCGGFSPPAEPWGPALWSCSPCPPSVSNGFM